jgi:hypothetical protein
VFTKVYPWQTEAQGTLKKLGHFLLEVTPLAQDTFAAALLSEGPLYLIFVVY